MIIEEYNFGRMMISGEKFSKDVIIYPHRVHSPWWREKGHYLQLRDIEEILSCKPDILVIGTGCFGVMKVAKEVEKRLRKEGIEYHIANSRRAADIFNSIEGKRKVGAFHLTC